MLSGVQKTNQQHCMLLYAPVQTGAAVDRVTLRCYNAISYG
jgi:hypothetical protein